MTVQRQLGITIASWELPFPDVVVKDVGPVVPAVEGEGGVLDDDLADVSEPGSPGREVGPLVERQGCHLFRDCRVGYAVKIEEAVPDCDFVGAGSAPAFH